MCVKRAKRGVHIFSLCGRRYCFGSKGDNFKNNGMSVNSFSVLLKFLAPFQQKSYLLRNAERS